MNAHAVWLAVASALMVIASVCSPGLGNGPDPGRYKSYVQQAEEGGLPVYWLGRTFAAGGIDFDWIDPEIDETTDDGIGWIRLTYVPGLENDPGTLDVATIRTAEVDWDRYRAPAQVARVDERSVEVAGSPATLFEYSLRGDRLTSRRLVIPRGDVTVVLDTSRFNGPDGEETNPLMDEATFLAVAGQLRPYEE